MIYVEVTVSRSEWRYHRYSASRRAEHQLHHRLIHPFSHYLRIYTQIMMYPIHTNNYMRMTKSMWHKHSFQNARPLVHINRSCYWRQWLCVSFQAEPIRVLVTGAAGQIAYSLLYSIAKGDVFGKDQVRPRLAVLLRNRTLEGNRKWSKLDFKPFSCVI